MAVVVGLEPLHQRHARGGLQAAVERGADVVAAVLGLGAERGAGAQAHFLQEVVRILVLGARRLLLHVQRVEQGVLHGAARGPAILGHLAQHPVAPGDGGGSALDGVVVGGALGEAREVGALGQRQLIQRLAEIVVGRHSHAIAVVPEPDLVEIEFEDALLGKRLLEAAGEDRFLHLAAEPLLVGQEHVLGHLLGDGGAALQAAAAREVPDVARHGAAQALHVDAAVLEEAVVLRREKRAHQLLRHLVVGHEDAALLAELADQRAVPGVDAGGGGGAVFREVGGVGQVVEQPGGVDRQAEPGHRDQAQRGDARDPHPASGVLESHEVGSAQRAGREVRTRLHPSSGPQGQGRASPHAGRLDPAIGESAPPFPPRSPAAGARPHRFSTPATYFFAASP